MKLIQALNDVGLSTEVRNGDNCAVLIFVKVASQRHLRAEVYRSRVQDWLYGVRTVAPDKDMQKSFAGEPITEAERLRLVYLLITKPRNEGGAGITPKRGEWKGVESVFALHDHAFNKAWIKDIASKYFLINEDFTTIRDRFGEKIAFYFAFLQSYFLFLLFPAGFGFCSWLLLGQYSPIYAIINGLWCIVFVEYWKKQEIDLAFQWGVRGVSKIQHKRPDFVGDSIMTDSNHRRGSESFLSREEIVKAITPSPICPRCGSSPRKFDCDLLLHRGFHLRSLQRAIQVLLGMFLVVQIQL